MAKTRCAVLPLESLGETERVAVVLRFDHIILDTALCSHPRDLADFTARLDPGQRLVLLQEPDHPFPESALNPRCVVRSVTLPFAGARKLAHSLCRLNPRLKVLFLSSHPGDLLVESGVLPPGARVLSKPLRRRDILEALESLVRTGAEWKPLSAGTRTPLRE